MVLREPAPRSSAAATGDGFDTLLGSAEETIRAIQTGEVDALVLATPTGPQVFTLETADGPYRVMLEEMSDGVASVSDDGLVLYANRRFTELTGVSARDAVGSGLSAALAIPEDEVGRLLTAEGAELDVSLSAGSGSELGIHVSTRVLPESTGAAWCVVVSDTTERTERLAAIVDRALDAIDVAALDGRVLAVNAAASKMTGYSRRELLAMTVWDFISPADRDRAARGLAARLSGGVDRPVSLELVAKDATPVHVEATGFITSTDAEEGTIELIVRDVTGRRALEEQLVRQATHDDLTGLPNRALFLDRLDQALLKVEREGGEVAVGILDLDNFKLVNDTLGHVAGDELLAGLAPRLVGALRASDTIARLGGDEFAVLLTGARSKERIAAVAGRLLRVFDKPLMYEGTEQILGGSLGIAVASPGQTAVQVIRNADVAMYRAKNAGRGRHALYRPAMRSEFEHRLEVQNEIAAAIEKREIRVAYQPIYDLSSGRVLGAEALARWQRPGGDLVPAGEFIEAIEEFGLTVQLAEQVASQTIGFLARCARVGADSLPWGVSMNVSAHEIGDDDFVTWLVDEVRARGIRPGAFQVEVTERILLAADDARFAENFGRLRQAGIGISLDDFGTAYAGLRSLLDSPFSTIKIDRSFVERLSCPSGLAVVTATTGLARSLGLRVVGEGIETAAQRDHLRRAQCEAGQGYLLARPMPEAAFEAFLDGRRLLHRHSMPQLDDLPETLRVERGATQDAQAAPDPPEGATDRISKNHGSRFRSGRHIIARRTRALGEEGRHDRRVAR